MQVTIENNLLENSSDTHWQHYRVQNVSVKRNEVFNMNIIWHEKCGNECNYNHTDIVKPFYMYM